MLFIKLLKSFLYNLEVYPIILYLAIFSRHLPQNGGPQISCLPIFCTVVFVKYGGGFRHLATLLRGTARLTSGALGIAGVETMLRESQVMCHRMLGIMLDRYIDRETGRQMDR